MKQRREPSSEPGSPPGSRSAVDGSSRPSGPGPHHGTARFGEDVSVRSRAATLAWLGWFGGIGVLWIGWGIVPAAGWWLFYWPGVLLIVLAYLYSPLSPEPERTPRHGAQLARGDSDAC